jgi:hypothetical protein
MQFLCLKGFLEELKRNEMSEFVKDSERMSDLKKQTITKIRELQTRWSAVLAWATKRTVYLNTVIANWREFRQREVTATEFIDGKEKDLQGINAEIKAGSDELTKEKVGHLDVRINLMFYVLFIYNMSGRANPNQR